MLWGCYILRAKGHFTSPAPQLSLSSPVILFAQFSSVVFADGPTKATQRALDKDYKLSLPAVAATDHLWLHLNLNNLNLTA